MNISIGKTISHYRIVEKLGSGGMGVIYKAEDLKLKRFVALKFLPPDMTRDADANARFMHEAQAASALEHSNICNIHEIDETDDGQVFIVMACYEGETLEQIISSRQLAIGNAIDITIQIANGLARAHEKGIIHRDIKPANIMVTDQDEVKILDFGLAKLLGQTKLTKEGTTLGTVAYMSPEQAKGEATDHHSDIWSLGVILYQMISGKLPFKGEYDQAVIYSIINEQPEPLSQLPAEIPSTLEKLIMKALAKDPKKRYQSMDAFIKDLSGILDRSKAIPTTTKLNIRPRIRSRSLLISLIATVIVLLIIAYFFVSRGGEEDLLLRLKIVVLPFENLGAAEDEYFAAGMTEEINNRLAMVSQLGVISRKSALHYQESNKTSKQIGQELAVQYILEGSIRWAKGPDGLGRVKITPRLIRVSDDTNIWTHTYEHVINDIFEIQSAIAQNVVTGLGLTLFEREQHAVKQPPTQNIEAYHAYLQGRYFAGRPHFTLDNWKRVISSYKRAVELDTTFALAYAHLAAAHARLHFFQHDLSAKRLQMAEQAAEKSIRLGPSLPQIHLALSYYHIWASRDPKKALKDLEIAEEKLPNNTEVLLAKTSIYELLGQFDEAISAYKRAFELSPRDANIPTNLLFMYWITRRHEKAIETANKAIALAPNEPWPYLGKTFAIWQWKGATRESRMVLESIPVQHSWLPWAWFWQEMYEGRYTEVLDRLNLTSGDWIRLKTWARPKKLYAAYAYQLLNMSTQAKRAYESAKAMLEKELQLWPNDPRLHSSLGIACAALGEKDKAIREGKRAVEILPISKDAIYGWPYLQDLAHIYTLVGEYEQALDQLEYILSIPCWFSTTYLKIDPRWNPLRTHPRYGEILKKYQLE